MSKLTLISMVMLICITSTSGYNYDDDNEKDDYAYRRRYRDNDDEKDDYAYRRGYRDDDDDKDDYAYRRGYRNDYYDELEDAEYERLLEKKDSASDLSSFDCLSSDYQLWNTDLATYKLITKAGCASKCKARKDCIGFDFTPAGGRCRLSRFTRTEKRAKYSFIGTSQCQKKQLVYLDRFDCDWPKSQSGVARVSQGGSKESCAKSCVLKRGCVGFTYKPAGRECFLFRNTRDAVPLSFSFKAEYQCQKKRKPSLSLFECRSSKFQLWVKDIAQYDGISPETCSKKCLMKSTCVGFDYKIREKRCRLSRYTVEQKALISGHGNTHCQRKAVSIPQEMVGTWSLTYSDGYKDQFTIDQGNITLKSNMHEEPIKRSDDPIHFPSSNGWFLVKQLHTASTFIYIRLVGEGVLEIQYFCGGASCKQFYVAVGSGIKQGTNYGYNRLPTGFAGDWSVSYEDGFTNAFTIDRHGLATLKSSGMKQFVTDSNNQTVFPSSAGWVEIKELYKSRWEYMRLNGGCLEIISFSFGCMKTYKGLNYFCVRGSAVKYVASLSADPVSGQIVPVQ